MQNKKGFTLIELLAVIVILAIIALIAVPVILNIIDKANKSAFKDTAYGIISAGELHFAEQQLELNGMSENVEFEWPNNVGTLQVKGNVPDGTKLLVNTEGKIALIMSNGRYCITKRYDDTDITVTENSKCYFPYSLPALATTGTFKTVNEKNSSVVSKVDECAFEKGEDSKCTPGTAFAIKVSNEETYKFYVLNDDGEKVTLIMDRNLYAVGNTTRPNVAWISQSDYNDDENYGFDGNANKGPLTVINALKTRTATWDNIIEKSYTYSGMGYHLNSRERIYEDITEKMKARIITYDETSAAGCSGNTDCPNWLYENLFHTGDDYTRGYWTSTAVSASSTNVYQVSYVKTVQTDSLKIYNDNGVRPVIELSK